ncbi:MAG TPA: hypothetical protein VJ650_06110 [Gemmatimonadaceae bacterium]|nr:hypothetical protein [Gemmatimonadaceae bacterium]
MIGLLALRHLTHRPLRSAFLLVGYGLGVGVMIVLLAIGEALLVQARDEKLVGGGDVTVLPEGIDLEVMKTGGVGGLFFSIDHARFIYRQLLAAPRFAGVIGTAAPQIEGKLLYLRTRGREYPVRAMGEIPSRTASVGGTPSLRAGAWEDDGGDRRWMAPTTMELYAEIDRFHLTPPDVADRQSWGEWHYFNVLSPDSRRWWFISFIIGGDVTGDDWGGLVSMTRREQGGSTTRFTRTHDASRTRFSLSSPDLTMGESRVTLLGGGRYRVVAAARGPAGERANVDLVITPARGAYFPGATLAAGTFTSGYTVPALRASASGRLCVGVSCEVVSGAQAYHDHNWGVWRGVTWEWGAARAGPLTFLYGRVHSPDTLASRPPLFLYVVDSLGFAGLYRPTRIDYADDASVVVDGRRIRVPSRATMFDVRGGDTVIVELMIEDAIGSDIRLPLDERGDPQAAALSTPYFIQMKGRARLRGVIAGRPVDSEGTGFFETYR